MQTLEDVLGSRVNIAILRHLTGILGGLSGNEIARRLRLQQSTVRQALERLVATGVVTRHDVGRSAAYELDRGLDFTRHVLAPLFAAEARLHETLVAQLAEGTRQLVPKPTAVVLFGSAARGARDFHDVDLLCVAASHEDKSALHDAVAGGFRKVRRRYGVPVGAVVATRAELRAPASAALVAEVRRDGVLLCGTAPAELRGVRPLEPGAALEVAR